MKFSKEDFESLKDAIRGTGIDVAAMRDKYQNEGKSKTRFYWDLFWASKWQDNNREVAAKYYDTHIETALKAAVSDLTTIKAPWLVLPMKK